MNECYDNIILIFNNSVIMITDKLAVVSHLSSNADSVRSCLSWYRRDSIENIEFEIGDIPVL